MRILVTGGAGFIGGAVIRRLLVSEHTIFNLDKLGYASDLTSVNQTLVTTNNSNYTFLNVDLTNLKATTDAMAIADPDLIMHLAAESHVDRSIDSPENFVASNILGTFHLLEAARNHWNHLSLSRKNNFRFHHISTDEVFGSLGEKGFFDELTPYDPRSPYSASKASSDHLVRSWFHTFGLPIVLTNCSNNFGPWQFPEKLIPLVIFKAIKGETIPIYGDGLNIRDWLFVEDHVDALLLVLTKGRIGESYCIGGNGERSNRLVVSSICDALDQLKPRTEAYANLIEFVEDRPGHDRRYAINSTKIQMELGWQAKYSFEVALETTITWYLENFSWLEQMLKKSQYSADRIGVSKN